MLNETLRNSSVNDSRMRKSADSPGSDNDAIVLRRVDRSIAAEICYQTNYIWFRSVSDAKNASPIQLVVFYVC